MSVIGAAAVLLLAGCASLPPHCTDGGPQAIAPACVAAPRCRFNCQITITNTAAPEARDEP